MPYRTKKLSKDRARIEKPICTEWRQEMVKTIEALFDGTVFHAVHRHIAVVTKGDSVGTRRRIGYMGLLVVVLSVGLLWTAQLVVAATGTPPIIRTFNAYAENRTGFTAPHLFVD